MHKVFFTSLFYLFYLLLYIHTHTHSMGAEYSTRRQKRLGLVDYGSLKPLGLYDQNESYDLSMIRELILSKKLAPFYKG